MELKSVNKPAFSVIGKEGTTLEGPGFVQRLWAEANAHFSEVAALAKREENGNLCGIWGAMSDLSGSFLPWEKEFTVGQYLAGVECWDDAQPPEGWKKWTVPGFSYLVAECKDDNTFSDVMQYLSENKIVLAGAVHDFTCPATGENYMFFPIKKL